MNGIFAVRLMTASSNFWSNGKFLNPSYNVFNRSMTMGIKNILSNDQSSADKKKNDGNGKNSVQSKPEFKYCYTRAKNECRKNGEKERKNQAGKKGNNPESENNDSKEEKHFCNWPIRYRSQYVCALSAMTIYAVIV